MRFAYVRACKLTLSARRQRISDVCKQPAPSRDRPPTLSQTVRGSQPAPTAASRRSKIGPFDRPRRYVSKHDCDRIPEVCEKTAPARDRPPTLSQTVRRLAQAPPTPFRDGRKSVASLAHTNMRATTEGAEIFRSGNLPAPSRHGSRLLSQTVRRLAQAPPTPFIDGRKSVVSRAHTNMRATTEGVEILRCGNSLPRRAMALGYSPRPCAGSRKHRRPRSSMVENRSRCAPTLT